ncbi:hypothetical protein LCGC14_0303660 [marine sediment metagenome]|uniref:HEAT repeat domain-containing protein n=1 Tax=marine sediment metagenome TaxID=412755 RepID=A0A0F9WB23_9ZZZZ|nr:hypothetical protein [Phycisphaerae bacterium]HDZ44294.1 hypothetical protein [Phycisphaerae bacterium]
MPTNKKWLWGFAGGAGLIALVVVLYPAKAQVTGETAKQRVESVVRIADDRSYGAADALARTAANDPDPTVRRTALVCLSAFGRSSDRPVIEAAMQDLSPSVRQAATKALIRSYDDLAAVGHLRDLLHDEDEDVRKSAASALTTSKNPHALVALVQTTDAEQTPDLQILAVRALGKKYRISFEVDPAEADGLARSIEIIKHTDEVIEAFRATGTPLHRNMELVHQMMAENPCHAIEEPTEGEGPAINTREPQP